MSFYVLDRKGHGFYTYAYSGYHLGISKRETKNNPKWERKYYQRGHQEKIKPLRHNQTKRGVITDHKGTVEEP